MVPTEMKEKKENKREGHHPEILI